MDKNEQTDIIRWLSLDCDNLYINFSVHFCITIGVRKISSSLSSFILDELRNHGNTRNTLDCDQSNYSSRIVFSHIPVKFGQTGISAIRFADPESPTVEPNMKWIGRPLAEIWPFEIFPNVRLSVGPQYINQSIKSNFIMKCDKRTQNIESSVRMTVQKKNIKNT